MLLQTYIIKLAAITANGMSGFACATISTIIQIKRAIQQELLLKFEQRQASDCVARAKLQGLV